jgi:hypothetical protein
VGAKMSVRGFIKTHKYGGVGWDLYNGSYGLVSARESNDGTVYADWAYPQQHKKPMKKAVPVKVYLGDNPKSAIAVLEAMIKEIKAESGIPVDSGLPDDDDIPF